MKLGHRAETLRAINTKQTSQLNMSSDENFYEENEKEEVEYHDRRCHFRPVGWGGLFDELTELCWKSILGR